MPEIRLLDKSVAELIAAGEVIERPSSVRKTSISSKRISGKFNRCRRTAYHR